jgi:N6-adenosine-specific RNA methylase IME4
MTDDEMRAMPIPMLQDEGLLFLWVTGRAMEIGRECLRVWGYTRVDEVVWVKTNQVGLFSMYASTTELIAIVNSSSASFARAERAIGSIIPRNICSSV